MPCHENCWSRYWSFSSECVNCDIVQRFRYCLDGGKCGSKTSWNICNAILIPITISKKCLKHFFIDLYNGYIAILHPTSILHAVGMYRSIQKLEELNVGMEDLGENMQALAQQFNGSQSEAQRTHTPESDGTGKSKTGVTSSTPQRGGIRGMPSLDESPVMVNQRWGDF